MYTTLIGNIMTKSIVSATPETPAPAVIELMRQRSYSCLVIAQEGRPVGIITERDVLKLANSLLTGIDGSKIQAQTMMTRPVTTLRDSANLAEALALCKYKAIRHLPVVDASGKLCGLLTQTDLMNGLIQASELQASNTPLMNPWELTQPAPTDETEDQGDIISDVNLNEVERDLKNIFHSMHADKNPNGGHRIQSRFI